LRREPLRIPPAGAAGFTLIEMIVVLTILGLVAGLTLPLFDRGLPSASLAAATAEIRAALSAAHLAAIAQDRPVFFASDGNGGYWLDGSDHRLGRAADAAPVLRVAISGAAQIAFYPSGGSSGGTVIVRGPNAWREIGVDAITGRVRLLP
jgi:general secretion pathway protein H